MRKINGIEIDALDVLAEAKEIMKELECSTTGVEYATKVLKKQRQAEANKRRAWQEAELIYSYRELEAEGYHMIIGKGKSSLIDGYDNYYFAAKRPELAVEEILDIINEDQKRKLDKLLSGLDRVFITSLPITARAEFATVDEVIEYMREHGDLAPVRVI